MKLRIPFMKMNIRLNYSRFEGCKGQFLMEIIEFAASWVCVKVNANRSFLRDVLIWNFSLISFGLVCVSVWQYLRAESRRSRPTAISPNSLSSFTVSYPSLHSLLLLPIILCTVFSSPSYLPIGHIQSSRQVALFSTSTIVRLLIELSPSFILLPRSDSFL